jgi:hypothetical protein
VKQDEDQPFEGVSLVEYLLLFTTNEISGFILTEGTSFILQENGSRILIEH